MALPPRLVTFYVVEPILRFSRIGGFDTEEATSAHGHRGKARAFQVGDLAIAIAARIYIVGESIVVDLDRAHDDMIAPPSTDLRPAIAGAFDLIRRAALAATPPVMFPPILPGDIDRAAANVMAPPPGVDCGPIALSIEDRRSLAPALQESLDWIHIRSIAAGELARLHAETIATGAPATGGLSAADLERLRALVDAWQPGQRPGRGGR